MEMDGRLYASLNSLLMSLFLLHLKRSKCLARNDITYEAKFSEMLP